MNPAQRKLAEGILYTDQYQLTMAQLYFRYGLHERTVRFDHFYRENPNYGAHQAGFCINAGMETLLDWMEGARFGEPEIETLRGHKNHNGAQLFADDFLDWLRVHGDFDGIHMRAIPEGRVVHPDVPLTVVEGPAAMAQILETPLLNILNYQTLIATKAARVSLAADTGASDRRKGVGDSATGSASGRGRLVLEFGMRRAHELGANAATRAALIGGADFSSNVGTSHVLGYPPRGTHAHSMVQLFMALGGDELTAFRAYADVYPDDCLLLVDTIHALESGVPNAIRVFEELRRQGHAPVGIRLDSGDLAYLAIQSAKLLNEAGFPDTSIVLSSDLDELVIWQVITQILQEAPRSDVDAEQLINRLVYGVGTRLVTSWGSPALGGVYKLVAARDVSLPRRDAPISGEPSSMAAGLPRSDVPVSRETASMTAGQWKPAIKISESADKTPNPGNKSAYRLYDTRGKAIADVLALDDEPVNVSPLALYHPADAGKFRILNRDALAQAEPLLEVVSKDKQMREPESIETIRERRRADVERLHAGVKRLVNPHIYHVSLTQKLWELKQTLIRQVGG